jgi:hypothetical protein
MLMKTGGRLQFEGCDNAEIQYNLTGLTCMVCMAWLPGTTGTIPCDNLL